MKSDGCYTDFINPTPPSYCIYTSFWEGYSPITCSQQKDLHSHVSCCQQFHCDPNSGLTQDNHFYMPSCTKWVELTKPALCCPAGSIQKNKDQRHGSEVTHKPSNDYFHQFWTPAFLTRWIFWLSGILPVWDVTGPLCFRFQQLLGVYCYLRLNSESSFCSWILRCSCNNDLMTSGWFPSNKYHAIPACPSAGSGKNRECWKEYGWVLKATSWRAPATSPAKIKYCFHIAVDPFSNTEVEPLIADYQWYKIGTFPAVSTR